MGATAAPLSAVASAFGVHGAALLVAVMPFIMLPFILVMQARCQWLGSLRAMPRP